MQRHKFNNVMNKVKDLGGMVVAHYDFSHLVDKLYHIDGIDTAITGNTCWVYLKSIESKDSQGNSDVIRVEPHNVIYFDVLNYIYRQTREYYKVCDRMFSSVFHRSLRQVESDLKTIHKLMEQYEALELIRVAASDEVSANV